MESTDEDDVTSVSGSEHGFDETDDDNSEYFNINDEHLYTWQYHCMGMAVEHSSLSASLDDYPTAVWHSLSQANQFRVLKIEGAESSGDPISVKLVTRTLDDPGTYYALSYALGGEDLTHAARCENHDVPITANLHAALLSIRKLFYYPDWTCEPMPSLGFRNRNVVERKSGRLVHPFIWADAVSYIEI